MKPDELFDFRQHITQLPEHQLSKKLLAIYWTSYFVVPLILVAFVWNDVSGVLQKTFEASPTELSQSARVALVLQSIGLTVVFSILSILGAALLIYFATKIFSHKINLKFWKLFNLYLYAKVWESLVNILVSFLLVLLTTIFESWFNSPAVPAQLILGIVTYLPVIIFYSIFIFGLFKIIPRKTITV